MVVAVVVSWLRLVVVFASFPAVASFSPVAASWLLQTIHFMAGANFGIIKAYSDIVYIGSLKLATVMMMILIWL